MELAGTMSRRRIGVSLVDGLGRKNAHEDISSWPLAALYGNVTSRSIDRECHVFEPLLRQDLLAHRQCRETIRILGYVSGVHSSRNTHITSPFGNCNSLGFRNESSSLIMSLKWRLL